MDDQRRLSFSTLKNHPDRQELSSSLPAEPRQPEFQFERPDWVLFRSVDTLSQKAGVPKVRLRRLVLKELTDNALDPGGGVSVFASNEQGRLVLGDCSACNSFVIQDTGPGLPGSPDEIANLFSIRRPLVSSKLWRMPSRGAMGNGLRVVAGAVAASNGRLRIWTRNRCLALTPQDDGTNAVTVREVDFPTGTRIEITFGPDLPPDRSALKWAEAAIRMASGGPGYTGKPSPWWYDGDHFFELLQAAGNRPVRDLVASLDGCTGTKAGKITAAFKNTACHALSRAQAVELLLSARAAARPVRPERLGTVGRLDTLPPSYSCEQGLLVAGGREPKARVPFTVEAWAYADRPSEDRSRLKVFLNRTPITGEVRVYQGKEGLDVYGCGLSHRVPAPKGSFDLVLNITTPFCPITTDGKEPDLAPFVEQIAAVIKRVARAAHRARPKDPQALSEDLTQKSVFLSHLEEGVAKASGNGAYRFNQRQLFYVLRPYVIEALGAEPSWENFCRVVTEYEEQHGDISGIYRDPRGTLYHPHIGQDIALGTLAVEQYRRPDWTFNKVLYIEKEGFFEALKAARWPERHDCALVTSKGFSTRAVRDLLDLLADSEEPVTVFCIHDADASGTLIFQTLQQETKARPRRRLQIINLGLEPWEAIAMDLEVEAFTRRDRRAAVAEYVHDRPNGEHWEEWLQTNRVELNMMTTPQFLAWLDAKMAAHDSKKLLPPQEILTTRAREQLEEHMRKIITDRILKEAGIAEQVADAMRGVSLPSGQDLATRVQEWLSYHRDAQWRNYVDKVAAELAGEQGRE
jgi:hypothetical protein